jgi:hypothetical protein
MQNFVTGHELIVTQTIDIDSFDPDEKFDFKENDLKFAFGVTDNHKREDENGARDDINMVTWEPVMVWNDGDKDIKTTQL